MLSSFVVFYTCINFLVNLMDFLYNRLYRSLNYYHDDDFVLSFSYKTHQLVLVAGLTFIFGCFVSKEKDFPKALQVFSKVPEIVTCIHGCSILVCVSMLLTFLLELTWSSPNKRNKIFKTELTKVFTTIVLFYFLSLILTWLLSNVAANIEEEQRRKEMDI